MKHLTSCIPQLDAVRIRLFPTYVLALLSAETLFFQRWDPGQTRNFPVWTLRVPEGVICGGQPLYVEALAELIGDFLAQQRLTGAHVYAAMPAEATCLPFSGNDWLESRELVALGQDQEGWIRVNHGHCRLLTRSDAVAAWATVFQMADLVLDRLVPMMSCWIDFLATSCSSEQDHVRILKLCLGSHPRGLDALAVLNREVVWYSRFDHSGLGLWEAIDTRVGVMTDVDDLDHRIYLANSLRLPPGRCGGKRALQADCEVTMISSEDVLAVLASAQG